MNFRKATEEDAKVLSRFMEELVEAPGDLELQKKQIKNLSEKEHYYLCLACQQEEVIGTAMGRLCEDICEDCRRFLVIENVFVREDWRGKGVAKSIFQELERWGKKHNCYYAILGF